MKARAADDLPSLPNTPLVGDKVRLKPERIHAYREACTKAGYEVDFYAVRVIVRADCYGPGGDRRYFVEGAPHCFRGPDLDLAWSSDADRCAGLAEFARTRGRAA